MHFLAYKNWVHYEDTHKHKQRHKMKSNREKKNMWNEVGMLVLVNTTNKQRRNCNTMEFEADLWKEIQ